MITYKLSIPYLPRILSFGKKYWPDTWFIQVILKCLLFCIVTSGHRECFNTFTAQRSFNEQWLIIATSTVTLQLGSAHGICPTKRVGNMLCPKGHVDREIQLHFNSEFLSTIYIFILTGKLGTKYIFSIPVLTVTQSATSP